LSSDHDLDHLLRMAAELQRLVPDAVVVSDQASVYHAHHRTTLGADHVVADLAARYDAVLEALKSTNGWITNRSVPGKVILGDLGCIETGVHQMRRRVPLEIEIVELGEWTKLRIPTLAETLRIKGFLIVARNQVRDYLDVAALSERIGAEHAGRLLAQMDDYYEDQRSSPDGIASQLCRQLADPRPKDARMLTRLENYKSLAPRWQSWDAVKRQLADIAVTMIGMSRREMVEDIANVSNRSMDPPSCEVSC